MQIKNCFILVSSMSEHDINYDILNKLFNLVVIITRYCHNRVKAWEIF